MSNYNYTYTQEENLMKDGDYEVTIDTIGVKTISTTGKEKLSIMYRVRNDVDQPYKNKCVFEDIWKERESPEHFNRRRINQLLGTQDVKEGTVFNGIEDIIEFLKGANLIIHISVVMDDYYDKNVNKVSYYRSSKAKPQSLDSQEEHNWVEISDTDEIPF